MAATKIFEGGPATKNSFNKKRAVRGRAPPVFRICVIAPSFSPDIIIMFYSLSYTPAVFFFLFFFFFYWNTWRRFPWTSKDWKAINQFLNAFLRKPYGKFKEKSAGLRERGTQLSRSLCVIS